MNGANPEVLRYAAFTRYPVAGNPAGVVLNAEQLDEKRMLQIAAEVGFSETAFLVKQPSEGKNSWSVRYFSPKIEVPFCGHATIASAVALAERGYFDELSFLTQAGIIKVQITHDDGSLSAALTSAPTSVQEVADADVSEALAALGWNRQELDSAFPPYAAYAGVHHLVLVASTRERLANLDYDYERLRELMIKLNWTTVHLAWRQSETVFHVRNAFPVGGVVEDPATGAAAAAFGGYLRELKKIDPPVILTLLQGEDMGRPSQLTVRIPANEAHVLVAGNAVRMS